MAKAYVYSSDHDGIERVFLFKTEKLMMKKFIFDVIEHIEIEYDEEDYSSNFMDLKQLEEDHGPIRSRFELAQKIFDEESSNGTYLNCVGRKTIRSRYP